MILITLANKFLFQFCFEGETMNNEVESIGGSTIETPKNEEPKKGCWRKLLEVAESCLSHKDEDKWLDQMKGNLGLIATVIATMTFQMALNPPGGIRSVRDDPHPPGAKNAYAYPPGANNGYANSPAPNNVGTEGIHCGKLGTYWDLCPGEAVIGASFPDAYFAFLVPNTICFVASLSVWSLACEWNSFESQVSCVDVIFWNVYNSHSPCYVLYSSFANDLTR
jgi:hypothetical protein